jgi:hypothetical protein
MSVVNPRPAVPSGHAIPEEVSQDEVTREVSGPADTDKGVTAVPAPVISEATVPVQSSIETSLLHEVLRRQSAEGDDEDKSG